MDNQQKFYWLINPQGTVIGAKQNTITNIREQAAKLYREGRKGPFFVAETVEIIGLKVANPELDIIPVNYSIPVPDPDKLDTVEHKLQETGVG